jgi:hypothetical protein
MPPPSFHNHLKKPRGSTKWFNKMVQQNGSTTKWFQIKNFKSPSPIRRSPTSNTVGEIVNAKYSNSKINITPIQNLVLM